MVDEADPNVKQCLIIPLHFKSDASWESSISSSMVFGCGSSKNLSLFSGHFLVSNDLRISSDFLDWLERHSRSSCLSLMSYEHSVSSVFIFLLLRIARIFS